MSTKPGQLHQDGILKDWSDQQILPGQDIPERIEERIKETDIFAFLLSQDFIGSDACQDEWHRASEIAKKAPSVIRVPIVLSDCSWKDMEGMSQLKALPEDGIPITRFGNRNTAWQQVYEGLKDLIEQLRKTFTIKNDFRKEIEKTDFLSQEHVRLQNIFVFPRLSSYTTSSGEENIEKTVDNSQQLLRSKYTLIHGEELSGKTALCRHLFLSMVDNGKPVIYVDLDTINRKARPDVFRDKYKAQFQGDYSLWVKQVDKIIILDNLSSSPQAIDHVLLAKEHFEKVLVTLSTDTFNAYYKDEDRLAQFGQIRILPLTHSKQEKLIRNRIKIASKIRRFQMVELMKWRIELTRLSSAIKSFQDIRFMFYRYCRPMRVLCP